MSWVCHSKSGHGFQLQSACLIKCWYQYNTEKYMARISWITLSNSLSVHSNWATHTNYNLGIGRLRRHQPMRITSGNWVSILIFQFLMTPVINVCGSSPQNSIHAPEHCDHWLIWLIWSHFGIIAPATVGTWTWLGLHILCEQTYVSTICNLTSLITWWALVIFSDCIYSQLLFLSLQIPCLGLVFQNNFIWIFMVAKISNYLGHEYWMAQQFDAWMALTSR